MISPFNGFVKRACSSILAALVLSVSVLVPLLDGADRSHGPVLESEHSATSCLHGHDHTICTQFGANHLLSSVGARPHGTSLVGAEKTRPVREAHVALVTPSTHNSRAPPLA